MKLKFEMLLDERNQDLWDVLQQVYSLEVKVSQEPGYLTSPVDGGYAIYVDIENISAASFTHELLHVYLKYKKVLISRYLKDQLDRSCLDAIFSTSLKVHLGNCLEHVKMLPLFLSRGFLNREFLRDYDQKIMEPKDMEQLSNTYFLGEKPDPVQVDYYIGKFYSMKASNNLTFDYSTYFMGLYRLDADLYQILDVFWLQWMDFELEMSASVYELATNQFIGNLVEWNSTKRAASIPE